MRLFGLIALATCALPRTVIAQDAILVDFGGLPSMLAKLDAVGNTVAATPSGGSVSFRGAAFDAAGNWYAASDATSGKGIERFSATGSQLNFFLVPQILAFPQDVSVFANGTVAVCDFWGNGIVRVSSTGQFLGSVPNTALAYGSTIDSLDHLWVCELHGIPALNAVKEFDQAGTLLSQFSISFDALDIVRSPSGELWIADSTSSRVAKYSSGGVALGGFPTAFASQLCGITMLRDGSLVVASATSSRLLRYSQTGTLLGDFPLHRSGAFRLASRPECGIAETYCTAGTSSAGCVAGVTATGTPSLASATPFSLAVAGIEGQRASALFHGVDNSGFTPVPWGLYSSYLCVQPPLQRMLSANSGGTLGACDGALVLDVNAWRAAHPGSLGQPYQLGQSVWVQAWYRQPPGPNAVVLSNALRFTWCP